MSKSESFPSSIKSSEKNESKHLLDVFPQGDAYLENYKRAKEKAGEPVDQQSLEAVRETLYSILDSGLKNSELYHSEETGAEFPYAALKLREIAGSVFVANHGVKSAVPAESPTSAATSKKEFIFTGIPTDSNGGGQFEWIEFAVEEIMRQLPQALEDLKQGIEPSDYEAIVVGYPTNEYGLVTEQLKAKLKEGGLGAMGTLYAGLIAKQLGPSAEKGKSVLSLKGVSMSASIAAETASELLKSGTVVQGESSDHSKPHMSVSMYAPAAVLEMNDGPLRTQQKLAGLAASYVYNDLFDSGKYGTQVLRKEMPGFLAKLRTQLSDRMHPRVDAEQTQLKNESLKILQALGGSGVSIPEGVKVTQIVGTKDPLIYSHKRNSDLAGHRDEYEGAVGEDLLQRHTPEVRSFGVDMGHQPPFYRDRVWEHFDRVAASVKEIPSSP